MFIILMEKSLIILLSLSLARKLRCFNSNAGMLSAGMKRSCFTRILEVVKLPKCVNIIRSPFVLDCDHRDDLGFTPNAERRLGKLCNASSCLSLCLFFFIIIHLGPWTQQRNQSKAFRRV